MRRADGSGRPVAGFVGELDDVRHWRRAFDEIELRRGRFRPRRRCRADWKHGAAAGRGDSCGNRRARRHQTGDPVEQLGGIGGHAGRRRKGARVLGRDAIDHREPGLDRGAVAGIGLAGERRREDDAALLLQTHEAVAPGRLIGTDIAAGDGDEAAAFGETRKRGADMADGGFGEAALDMRRGREGRVHQNDARPDRGIETVVDLLGVVPGDRRTSRNRRPSRPARVSAISFKASRALASSAKIASSPVPAEGSRTRSAGGQRGRLGGDEAERDRRRELLQAVRIPRTGASATAAARQGA